MSQRGNWKDWLFFMLKAIEYTSMITFHKINEIVSAKDSILEFIKKDTRKVRSPEDLVNALFTQPFTKVKHLVDSGIYSENTARDYLKQTMRDTCS